MAATGDLKSPGRETVWVRVPPRLPQPNRVKAQRQGGKRKSAMPSLVKSQKPHVSHRSAAESRLGQISRGHIVGKYAKLIISSHRFKSCPRHHRRGSVSITTSTSHGRRLWRTSGPIIHKSPFLLGEQFSRRERQTVNLCVVGSSPTFPSICAGRQREINRSSFMRNCWNGRQARLRTVCGTTCGFKSHVPHHSISLLY